MAKGKKLRSALIYIGWVIAWHVLSVLAKNDILFVGPVAAAKALYEMCHQRAFWLMALNSSSYIAAGFAYGYLFGAALGALCYKSPVLEAIFAPIRNITNSVPVASFVIAAIILFGTSRLSLLISAIIVFPQSYQAAFTGLGNVPESLKRMASAFRIPWVWRFSAVTRPAVWPYLEAAAASSIGMAWKSGVAAEVMGMASSTIGEGLYLAKVYLNTDKLVAYTALIAALSYAMQKVISYIIAFLGKSKAVYKISLKPKSYKALAYPLSCKALSKEHMGVPAFKDVSFELSAGGTLCVIGPSGCGKSTLLMALAGLVKPTEGAVESQGPFMPSVCFQSDELCEALDSITNIQIATGLKRPEIEAALTELLDSQSFSKPVSELSGGMRRRVCLARAMLAPSSAVILDEPFSGLDKGAKEKAANFALSRLNGRMLIYSAHDGPDPILGGERLSLG